MPLTAPVPSARLSSDPPRARAPVRRPTRHERRIAAGLRTRDPRALETAYAEFGRAVFGYLRQAVGDHGAAEDIQQQVFTELWRRGPAYDPERSSILSFVMTIARSRAIDHLRKRVPEPRDPSVAAELSSGEATAPTDALLERWRVAHLLSRIPREEADLLRMRFYAGLSQREIAERTGIPLGTVKMRMVEALGRLRELIDAEEAVPA